MRSFGIPDPEISIHVTNSTLSTNVSVLLLGSEFLSVSSNKIAEFLEADDFTYFTDFEIFEPHCFNTKYKFTPLALNGHNEICINATGIEQLEHIMIARPNKFNVINEGNQIDNILLTGGSFPFFKTYPKSIEEFNKLITIDDLDLFNSWQEVWVPSQLFKSTYNSFLKKLQHLDFEILDRTTSHYLV